MANCYSSCDGCVGTGDLHRIGLNFEIDAGNLSTAVRQIVASALAKLSETDVAVTAQFDTRSNQDRIDIDACLALKLEQHIHGA